MTAPEKRERRSLRYIRLAAYLASQPRALDRIVMGIDQIEELLGQSLPDAARFPSWWRNDLHRAHSRAWITAGWKFGQMRASGAQVEFVRAH